MVRSMTGDEELALLIFVREYDDRPKRRPPRSGTDRRALIFGGPCVICNSCGDWLAAGERWLWVFVFYISHWAGLPWQSG
jgi:hypothetical protein